MMIVDAGEGIGKLGVVETGISHKVRYDAKFIEKCPCQHNNNTDLTLILMWGVLILKIFF